MWSAISNPTSRPIELRVDAPADVQPTAVESDPARLNQVLANLVNYPDSDSGEQ